MQLRFFPSLAKQQQYIQSLLRYMTSLTFIVGLVSSTGMIFLLLNDSCIHLESHWLPPMCESHYFMFMTFHNGSHWFGIQVTQLCGTVNCPPLVASCIVISITTEVISQDHRSQKGSFEVIFSSNNPVLYLSVQGIQQWFLTSATQRHPGTIEVTYIDLGITWTTFTEHSKGGF